MIFLFRPFLPLSDSAEVPKTRSHSLTILSILWHKIELCLSLFSILFNRWPWKHFYSIENVNREHFGKMKTEFSEKLLSIPHSQNLSIFNYTQGLDGDNSKPSTKKQKTVTPSMSLFLAFFLYSKFRIDRTSLSWAPARNSLETKKKPSFWTDSSKLINNSKINSLDRR